MIQTQIQKFSCRTFTVCLRLPLKKLGLNKSYCAVEYCFLKRIYLPSFNRVALQMIQNAPKPNTLTAEKPFPKPLAFHTLVHTHFLMIFVSEPLGP